MHFHLEFTASAIPGWLIFSIVLLLFWWLFVLVKLLNRSDMKATDKICWTIVVIFLCFIGLLLYVFFAPRKPREVKRLNDGKKKQKRRRHAGYTDADLARRANEGRL